MIERLENGQNVCTVIDFPLDVFATIPVLDRKITKTKNTKLLNIITAFDIETTRIKSIEQSVMYIWQWHFADPINLTVIGRTWLEFEQFCADLQAVMNAPRPDKEEYQKQLCVYVHNLSYEFQFLRGIYRFTNDEIFAVDRRKILKCTMYDNSFEFRCSYLHSNMSLDAYTHKMGAVHGKLSGIEYDYDKPRYPWTELTHKELAYCVNDVLGLCEALTIEMTHDRDTLYTIPLTSTGYVRRDARAAIERSGVRLTRQQPGKDLYLMLRQAFRGGNTHANRYFTGQVIRETVHSADRSSSYPDVLCNCLYPVRSFEYIGKTDYSTLCELLCKRRKALIFDIKLTNVRLIKETWGCPYLTVSKSRNIVNSDNDNGRILSADYLETTITDVDMYIIMEEYTWDAIEIENLYQSSYGKLPHELIKCAIDYYRAKTELKNVQGQELYYMKSKNKLNSIYGMMAQDPGKPDIVYNEDEEFEIDTETPVEKLLFDHQKNAFLCYQWGVWVTAWARYRLEEGIRLAGDGFLYCDTDSVKYLGDIDWDKYNKKRIRDSKASGAYAKDPNGITHYMGVYESEHDMCEFSTLGAKKYCYRETPDSPLKCTIAGVNKSKGAKELEAHGGINAFKPGFIFRAAGGTESVYNDKPEIGGITINGHYLSISSNVVIRDSTYQLSITDEYFELIERCAQHRNGAQVIKNYFEALDNY